MKKNRVPRGRYWILAVAATQLVLAWLMSAVGMLYPPIPMFAAAILAGVLYRGRAGEAARIGVLAGVLGGLPAEWIYFGQRAVFLGGDWQTLGFWEKAGLGFAELLLYAALLGFFAAFIGWGTEHQKAQPKIKSTEPEETENWAAAAPLPPFSPETLSGLAKIDRPQDRKKP